MSILEVEDLHKRYGNRTVVNGISFAIEKKECFGLLGHNGAGKSTTLECILQVRKADAGSITLFGKKIHKKDNEIMRHIGVQFQESGFPDKMKVDEACRMTCAMYGVEADIDSYLKQFHLEDFKRHMMNELSGGERQRLSVLLAMLPKPKLLCLDELTTGLDAQARRALWKYIQAYKEAGNSILLTSHYMDEVEALCDRIAILKKGVMIFVGTVEEAKKKSQCATLEEAYLRLQEEEI